MRRLEVSGKLYTSCRFNAQMLKWLPMSYFICIKNKCDISLITQAALSSKITTAFLATLLTFWQFFLDCQWNIIIIFNANWVNQYDLSNDEASRHHICFIKF